jgi:hypothetical protein
LAADNGEAFLFAQEDDIMSKQDNEREAVRTTIVGGRPPGSGRDLGDIPRGLEVLLKKASVDTEFRARLLEERGAAAAAIELELDPAESAMLQAIPRAQLDNIVAQTVVPVEQRRVFLGRLAAPMLAVLGIAVTGCPALETNVVTLGVRPDTVRTNQPPANPQPVTPPPAGIRPDKPPTNLPPARPPATNSLPSSASRGIRPDLP